MTVVVDTVSEVRDAVARARSGSDGSPAKGIAFVPTMGYLHAGHLELVHAAKEEGRFVVVSIFVNPLQFGKGEDLDRYPRDLDADVAKLQRIGVDVVFAPTVDEMYPEGPNKTTVSAGFVGSQFEGRSRPGHFDGMLTVVAKLLNIVQPDVAVFGKKDAQQLFLVRRMVSDLNIPTTIVGVDIVRENDGLARSSRNIFLDERARRSAVLLSRALEAAASSADRGIDAVLSAAQSVLMGGQQVKLDYLSIVDPATFSAVPDGYRGTALVLVAATVGDTRLIDNETIFLN